MLGQGCTEGSLSLTRSVLKLSREAKTMPVSPRWTREELILALDLYFRIQPLPRDEKHPEVVRLSEILRQLPIHKERPDPARFRSPMGVLLKLRDLSRFDPPDPSPVFRGSKLDEEVWNEFAGDRERLAEAVQAVLKTL